ERITVTIGPSSTVVLSRDPGQTECEVCVVDGTSSDCSSTEKTLKSAEKLPLEFRCLQPQDVFSMKMTTKIECTKISCNPAVAEVDPELFKGFKKTITWDISVPDRTVLTLDFPRDGLKQISASENCEDGFQYMVSTTRSDKQLKTSSYCKGGTESKLDLLGAKTVTVEVPKGGELDRTIFSLKASPRTGRIMSVTSDPFTNIIISRGPKEPDCQICVTEGSQQTCSPQNRRLKNPHNTSVEFTCPQPQNIFNVEINREIDCTETTCSGNTVHTETKFFPDFNRTFVFDFKVVATRAFQMVFEKTGLRQIPNGETCPDDHTYSVIIFLRTGLTNIGTFCKGGHVTNILARYKGRLILKVPGNVKVDPVDFQLNVGPETKMMAIIKVNLPRGVSDTDFITPNYPKDFPDQQQIQWEFIVPGMHNYTVLFLDHLTPVCLNGGVGVEYQQEDKRLTKRLLTDPQPQHYQGNFNLVLTNCETNSTLTGLSLSYRVSVMRSGHPASLSVPTLDSCLPIPLQNFTWQLTIPNEATLDLVSPTGSLRQSLPGEECDPSTSLRLVEAGGFSFGDFCSNGVIQKLQVHANISVTIMPQDFTRCTNPLLNVSVSPEITGNTRLYVTKLQRLLFYLSVHLFYDKNPP
ncbi:hypothetical protein XENOCAPTIV_012530, partial [Xenoophorus captivus]